MSAASDQDRFWQWFEGNNERLQAAVYGNDRRARERAIEELAGLSKGIAPGLTLEIGKDRKGKRHTLIVSVDGNLELVDAAKDFVDAAPAVPGWKIVAFRPRDELVGGMEIALNGERVAADDIWFRVTDTCDGLDLVLYVRGLTASNKGPRGVAAFLFAEHVVGERDTLTLLNSRAAEPLPQAPSSEGLRPLRELADVFDQVKATKFPPPGKLPIGLKSEWAIVQGTKNGSPLVGMLHLGLRPMAGHPDYDRRLTLSIPFQGRFDGLPARREEYLAVCELGERLTEILQEGQQSLLTLAITATGRRELIFHTANAEAALQRLARFRAAGGVHNLEAEVERDTFWDLYRSFCPSPGSDETEDH